MFRLFGFKQHTMKVSKSHAPGRRQNMSENTMRTLGTGDIYGAVLCPPGESRDEWFAVNTVDFHNEVRMIWDIVCEIGVTTLNPGEGFPPGFEYRWVNKKGQSPQKVSGPEYVNNALSWIDTQLSDESIFPAESNVPYPSNFLPTIRVIFSRIFRVYAIVYANFFQKLRDVGAATHLNSSLKHFLYFAWEFDLLPTQETAALQDIVDQIRERYNASKASARVR